MSGAIGVFSLDIGAPMAYRRSMAGKLMTVAETPLFIRQASGLWDDDERLAFIDFIAANPEAGDVIPETGGVRKLRWSRPGSGKRGGARVVYFYHSPERPLYLLMVHAKARKEDLSADDKRRVRMLTALLKGNR